tara:strand:- start:30492 stop:30941 length:450 start_codon:yes stop_codon:yes gene_type:complete
MLLRVTLIVSLLMNGFAVAESCEPESVAESQFLTVKLYEQGEQKKVLAENTLQVPQTGELSDFSGGTPPSVQGEAALKVGVRVTGAIKPADQGRFRIALKLQVGSRVESPDPETQVVRTETVEIRSDLKTGVTKRFHCGGQQWLELRLE